jgi:hypothetical protein
MWETAFMDEVLGRVFDAVGRVANTVLEPWGGAAAYVDAYESAIRAVTDAQRTAARAVEIEPVRSALVSCADLTRDIGATHLARARWVLDV